MIKRNIRVLVSTLPWWAKSSIIHLLSVVNAFVYYGHGRSCPLCLKSSRKFCRAGGPPRDDAQCPRCRALERHRLLWIFLQKKTNFFEGEKKDMLHIAPEVCLESKFRQKVKGNYLTADILPSKAMVTMDITDIQYSDESFDMIYCSHVLEHVADDRKAMKEFFRVLKVGGWAVLVVPIKRKITFEDPSIVCPQERLRIFGQRDHVRLYGADFIDRLCDSGFNVETYRVKDLVNKEDALKMGLSLTKAPIFFCRKS